MASNPRNVRNFWTTVTVDGRVSKAATGPQAKDGGMAITVQYRQGGEVSPEPLEIACIARRDGTLLIEVSHQGKTVYTHVAER
jgi:hypothetical protein